MRVSNCPHFSIVLSVRIEGLKGWGRRRDVASEQKSQSNTPAISHITDIRFECYIKHTMLVTVGLHSHLLSNIFQCDF